jgi:hypothetical protein
MSSSIVPLRKHPSGRAPSLELPQWWVLKNSMLWHHRWCSGCNLKHKGSACDQDHMLWLQTHLCDYRHTYVTRDTLMQLDFHIGDVICDWSHEYVNGGTICVWRCNCATAPDASSLGDMPIRIAYVAGHFDLFSLSPLMYYFTFMQATLIHLHNKTRSTLVTHHYYCIGISSNRPWWI